MNLCQHPMSLVIKYFWVLKCLRILLLLKKIKTKQFMYCHCTIQDLSNGPILGQFFCTKKAGQTHSVGGGGQLLVYCT
jgi:hypothetical protein